MKWIADTHTHTMACDHAYSTLAENVAAAAKKGLRFLALTEHTPSMPGAPTLLHFNNLRILPQEIDHVVLLKGAEVNIMDNGNGFDLPDSVMGKLDWVIASFHTPTFRPATSEIHTEYWLRVAENPLIDIIGHCGDGRYPFDEERVMKAFAKHGKIVEINAHSFTARPGSEINCSRIARLCAREGVRVVVSSDAHHCTQVGRFDAAERMLKEICFPEKLILNSDYHRFWKAAMEKAAPPTRAYLESLGKEEENETVYGPGVTVREI